MTPIDETQEIDAARKIAEKKSDAELRTLLATTRGTLYKVYYQTYMARKQKKDEARAREDHRDIQRMIKNGK